MSISINTLKKNKTNFDRLTKEIEKINNTSKEYSNTDDRYWRAKSDKAGNGYAVIRFLPVAPVDGDYLFPYVHLFRHGFMGPTGKWYIENSLTSIEGVKDDPLTKLNTLLWKTEDKDFQNIARNQKRKLTYTSNIYVVSDPASPENEGKVFLFSYGKKIFDKIQEAIFPPFPGKKSFDPFDLWDGANFLLKIRKVGGYQNYDLSNFDTNGPLLADEAEMETIWNKEYSLTELVAPDKFKAYAELKKQLDLVIGCDTESDAVFTAYTETVANRAKDAAGAKKFAPKAIVTQSRNPVEESDKSPFDEDDNDEVTMDYFKNLAKSS